MGVTMSWPPNPSFTVAYMPAPLGHQAEIMITLSAPPFVHVAVKLPVGYAHKFAEAILQEAQKHGQ